MNAKNEDHKEVVNHIENIDHADAIHTGEGDQIIHDYNNDDANASHFGIGDINIFKYYKSNPRLFIGIVVVVILGIVTITLQATDNAILRLCQLSPMTSGMNIIVTDFPVMEDHPTEALSVARSSSNKNLFSTLVSEIDNGSDRPIEFFHWQPCIKRVLTDEILESVINQTNAHLIIYGYIIDENPDDQRFEICPRFHSHIDYAYADVILGHDNMEDCIASTTRALDPEFVNRILLISDMFQVIDDLTFAGDENTDIKNYENILSDLDSIADNNRDIIPDGLLYMLLGEIAHIANHCEPSLSAFSAALEMDSQHTRSILGLSNTLSFCGRLVPHWGEVTINNPEIFDIPDLECINSVQSNLVNSKINDANHFFNASEDCLSLAEETLNADDSLHMTLLHYYQTRLHHFRAKYTSEGDWTLVHDQAIQAVTSYNDSTQRQQQVLEFLEVFRVWEWDARALIQTDCNSNVDEAIALFEMSEAIFGDHPNETFSATRTAIVNENIEDIRLNACEWQY